MIILFLNASISHDFVIILIHYTVRVNILAKIPCSKIGTKNHPIIDGILKPYDLKLIVIQAGI